MSKDMSNKLACQLDPNPDFLCEADFIDGSGNYRKLKATIEKVEKDLLQLPGLTQRQEKTVLSFQGKHKRLVCNKTNQARIKAWHGKKVKEWLGKSIELEYDLSVRNPKDPDDPGGVRVVKKK